jgi:pyrroloquinoline quinone biosynthesis protein B
VLNPWILTSTVWVAEAKMNLKIPFSTLTTELFGALFLLLCFGCEFQENKQIKKPTDTPYLVVLGIAQDAGYPQAGQIEEWKQIKSGTKMVGFATSLGLVDPISNERWLFDATPNFNIQLDKMDEFSSTENYPFDGIFLTHAHIGHYTGLMQLGREVMGARDVPVYAMPRMSSFLTKNGPWSQLVSLNNISLQPLENKQKVALNKRLSVTPIEVPHRGEFSETVGFLIESANKSLLFIPDIDKWQLWDESIVDWIKKVDIALLDATFYANGEIPGRDMSEIPHPFVEESMSLFESLSLEDKAKVHFIHFNHTNPLLFDNSPETKAVKKAGYNVARQGQLLAF